MLNSPKFGNKFNYELIGKYAGLVIIFIGVMLRIMVYLQCNGMYVDEANIARNVFERSYTGLIQPLNYEQYAPPVFLWFLKVSTSIFGLSEYGFRLYPLLCGVLSLFVLLVVLRYFVNSKVVWYPLLLLALGPIYVRYAVAAKQYIPDMLFALVIVWVALQNRIEKKSALRLFILWFFVGSLAIWSSMASVFVLAGVGSFYLIDIVKYKYWNKFWFLLCSGAVWLLQFGAYYFIILKAQANSDYLQNFHQEYFFYFPTNPKIFQQDIDLFMSLFATVGGHQVLSMVLHIGCILVACFYLLRNDLSRLALLGVPLAALMCAAGLHQYSLIPRLTLFVMPLLLVLIAVGFQKLLESQFLFFRIASITCALICFINFNALKQFVVPMKEEEIAEGLCFLKEKKVVGSELYVQNLAWPAYKYYTEIHPRKDAISSLQGAHFLSWNVNFDSLSKTFTSRTAIIYGWDESDRQKFEKAIDEKYIVLTDSDKVKGGSAYIYQQFRR